MLLSFNNVSTGYGKKEILHNVSFEIRSGEIVALAGSNGAGKSTILRTTFSFNEIWNNGENFKNSKPVEMDIKMQRGWQKMDAGNQLQQNSAGGKINRGFPGGESGDR